MMKSMDECARSAVMLDEEMSKYVIICYKRDAQQCTLSPNIFKVHTNDLIVAAGAENQGITVGGGCVVGIDVYGRLRGDIGNTRRIAVRNEEVTRIHLEMRVTANVKQCAVVVCNKDKVNPV